MKDSPSFFPQLGEKWVHIILSLYLSRPKVLTESEERSNQQMIPTLSPPRAQSYGTLDSTFHLKI